MIFCKEQRATLRVEEPQLAFGRLGQRLGELWRDMTAEEKSPYEERANVDRQRYKTQMTAYQTQQMRRQMMASRGLTHPLGQGGISELGGLGMLGMGGLGHMGGMGAYTPCTRSWTRWMSRGRR